MPLDQTTYTDTKPDVFSIEGLIAWLDRAWLDVGKLDRIAIPIGLVLGPLLVCGAGWLFLALVVGRVP